MMNYKGYTGYAVYDDEAHIFHGELVGIRAVITFQGTTVAELEQAFKDSVDDYLKWCKQRGKEPEKAVSGKLNLRMSPELYVKVAAQAAQHGMSINSYIINRLNTA
jgi:predicted HicB family RNase H-like nuclease